MARLSTVALPTPLTQASLTDWVRVFIAPRVGLPAEQIGVDVPLEEFGLGSLSVVQASGDLEKALSLRLPPGLLYEHATISALAAFLAGELGCADPAP